jgi:hypothetical protein
MNIQKAFWTQTVIPFASRCLCRRWTTKTALLAVGPLLDNVDTSKDIVLASASKEAFAGIPWQHSSNAPASSGGQASNFREDSYYDPQTQKFYDGIYVDVYVSKGAPDRFGKWYSMERLPDSLSVVRSPTPRTSSSRTLAVRFAVIKAYDLIELSLVDSPANQLCDVVSITKSADGTTSVHGMVTQVVAENVFWCKQRQDCFYFTG